jgi:hypothetical protein
VFLAGGVSSETQEETLHKNLTKSGVYEGFFGGLGEAEPAVIQVVLHVGGSANGKTACMRILKILCDQLRVLGKMSQVSFWWPSFAQGLDNPFPPEAQRRLYQRAE